MQHGESFGSSSTRQIFALPRPMVSYRKGNWFLLAFSTKSLSIYSTTLSSKMNEDDIYLCISVMCLLSYTGGIYLPTDRKTGKPQSSSFVSPYRTEVIGGPKTFEDFSMLETPVVLNFLEIHLFKAFHKLKCYGLVKILSSSLQRDVSAMVCKHCDCIVTI